MPCTVHLRSSTIPKTHHSLTMLIFNTLFALTAGIALSHATFYPGSGRFECSVADRLENSSCCYKLDFEALLDKCEPGTTDYSSTEPYDGRPKPRLTKIVIVSEMIGRDEFWRDPCNSRQGRPACCDLGEGVRVCCRVSSPLGHASELC